MTSKIIQVMIAGIIGWIGCACILPMSLWGIFNVTRKDHLIESYTTLTLMIISCSYAFWSFYHAYKRSRANGASSIYDLYQDLAFRFCITPFLVFAVGFLPLLIDAFTY